MAKQTTTVTHLGGIEVAYRATDIDSSKPTLVMVHSFMTSSNLYNAQFSSSKITSAANLIAVDLLGHGGTHVKSGVEQFTYWDSAIMINQLLEHLKIEKYFAVGTSQGGWIVTRMALLAPSKLLGIIPLGTSMDYESQRTKDLGCWDVAPMGNALISGWTSTSETPDFKLDDEYCGQLADLGIGSNADPEVRKSLIEDTKSHYTGDLGRRKARMATINLKTRDGIHDRLSEITCPVLWMHGTADPVYSVANAQEEIKLFVHANAEVVVVEGGAHFLSASHPGEVEPRLVEFIKAHGH